MGGSIGLVLWPDRVVQRLSWANLVSRVLDRPPSLYLRE